MIGSASEAAPSWKLKSGSRGPVLTLTGNWIAQSGAIPNFPGSILKDILKGQVIAFDAADLGHWDTGLIAFLSEALRAAAAVGVEFDKSTLPDAIRKLLGLLSDYEGAPSTRTEPGFHPIAAIGGGVVAMLTELGELATLLGQMIGASASAMFGRTRMRASDLLANLRDAGPSALFIVGVVNFLIGAILAFVGAAELQKFAAGVYVANLVGIALVRELTPVMTAIVMAGRTGGSYAARISTMVGGEEIDALKVTGIDVYQYLLLPAVVSLTFTLPLLFLYGCLVGIIGGMVVSISMLSVTPIGYIDQTLEAVSFQTFVFGFFKSIAFALLIGVTSCRLGLKAGRSSADVGAAATRAVVDGIVGVIALDALFAVAANAVGI